MKKLAVVVFFCLLGLTQAHAQAQYGDSSPCDHLNTPPYYEVNLGLYTYCDNSDTITRIASRPWVAANFASIKPNVTGSLSNSSTGCASTTVTLSGAAVGNNVNSAFYGSSAVPAGLIIDAQVTATDTVTVNICNLLGLPVDSRTFIVTLL